MSPITEIVMLQGVAEETTPPERESDDSVLVNEPPQFGSGVSVLKCKPEGSVSVNPTPVRFVPLGLLSWMCRTNSSPS
jgi:hypothetical protein